MARGIERFPPETTGDVVTFGRQPALQGIQSQTSLLAAHRVHPSLFRTTGMDPLAVRG